MSGVLVVAETRRGAVRDVSLELLTAARAVSGAAGGRVVLAVIDAESEMIAAGLAGSGADEVLAVTAPCAHFEAHAWAAALEALIDSEQPMLVILGHTIDSLGFAPAVAARRSLGFASDVTALEWGDELRVRRGAYGEKLEAELAFRDKSCTLVTLRAGAFAAADLDGVPASVRAVNLQLGDAVKTEHLGFQEEPADEADIGQAPILLAIGRGVEDEDEIPRFEELARRLGATLCASRPLVDAGWLPSSRQVGQSGKTVKPRVYLAFGISGAAQHLAGMRGAEKIIAVNTDAEAPIFGVAHLGAVADLFDVADALEQALE